LGAELFEFPDLAVFKVIIFLIAGRIYYKNDTILFLPLESLFTRAAMCYIASFYYLVGIAMA